MLVLGCPFTYRGFSPTAFLALEGDVAEEGIPTQFPTLKQQGKREVGNPAAGARQAQERVALAHRLPNRSRAPPGIEFHASWPREEQGTRSGVENKKPPDLRNDRGLPVTCPAGTWDRWWGENARLAWSDLGGRWSVCHPAGHLAAGSTSAREVLVEATCHGMGKFRV